jgi:hypothetical protein
MFKPSSVHQPWLRHVGDKRAGVLMPVTAGQPTEDDDLASVLHYVGYGKLARTRAKLANSQSTRQFLDIGVHLLREDLIGSTGPDFDSGLRSKLFGSISRDRVLEVAENDERYQSDILTVGQFRNLWDLKDRYTEDLISYMFRLAPQNGHLDAMFKLGAELAGQVALEEFIDRFAETEVQMILCDPFVEVQTIVQNAMPNHPRVREFCRAQLDHLLPRWAQLYEGIADVYGLKLQSGWSWEDVALTFNILIEGELAWTRVADRPRLSNGMGVLPGIIKALLPRILEAR